MNYLIAGNGPAGVSAIEKIREIDPSGRITLVTKEPFSPYSRIMMPEYMTGEVPEENLYFRGTDFASKVQVEVLLGNPIEHVAPEQQLVRLIDGTILHYDRLLLATGSRPVMPRWVDTDIRGVFTLWTKEDAERIRAVLPKVRKAVVIGGGLVGLQAARALQTQGIQVSVVEMAEYLMSTQLDPIAGEMLLKALFDHGVEVLLGTKVESLQAEDGWIKEVLSDHGNLPADLVLVATGVKPNLEFLQETTLSKEQGIRVDDHLETSLPHIYAAGDVVQTKGRFSHSSGVRALWLNAIQQGKIAGANMAGERVRYPGSWAMNSIQLFGLPIISFGEIAGEGLEEQILHYPSSGKYHKVFLRQGKLVGALLAGEVQGAGIWFHKLNESLSSGYWGKMQFQDIEFR